MEGVFGKPVMPGRDGGGVHPACRTRIGVPRTHRTRGPCHEIARGEMVHPPKGQALRYQPDKTMPLAIGTGLLVAMAALVVFGGGSPKPAAPPAPSDQAAAPKTPA